MLCQLSSTIKSCYLILLSHLHLWGYFYVSIWGRRSSAQISGLYERRSYNSDIRLSERRSYIYISGSWIQKSGYKEKILSSNIGYEREDPQFRYPAMREKILNSDLRVKILNCQISDYIRDSKLWEKEIFSSD
jgi:hypothetical protein